MRLINMNELQDTPTLMQFSQFMEIVKNSIRDGKSIFSWEDFEDIMNEQEAHICVDLATESNMLSVRKSKYGFKAALLNF